MSRIILTTATCDNSYLDVFKSFLASMRLNGDYRGGPIRADLINGNDDIYGQLKKIYPNLEINHISMKRSDWIKQENMIHIMRKRMTNQYNCFEEGWDQILTLDCDAIIRKPISGIFDGVDPDVLKVWYRKRKLDIYKFQAGVMVYGNSAAMRSYYRDFLDSIGSDWGFFDAQKAFYTVYLKHKGKIKHLQLRKEYNDCKFKSESYIWHAKLNHMNEKVFKDQLELYLKAAEGFINE